MRTVGHWFARAVGAATVGLLAIGPSPAAAATLTVNTTSDELTLGDQQCSLREAVAAVNAPAAATDCAAAGFGANTIVLGTHRYLLTMRSAGQLNVAGTVNSLTISGAGENATVIDATGLGDRVLQVSAGATVAISAITLMGGHAADGPAGSAGTDSPVTGGPGGAGGNGASGGGIENDGTLTLDHVVVSGNRAGAGGDGGRGGDGQVAGAGGPAGGPGAGGGIFNDGTLTVTDSSITNNAAGSGGVGGDGGRSDITIGGIGGAGGPGGGGGGIDNGFGTVTIVRSTISANAAGDAGTGGRGGESDGSKSPGAAGGDGNAGGQAGGIFDSGGSVTVTNSTIAGNRAGNGGNGGPGGFGANMGSGGSGGAGSDGGVGGGFYGFGGTDSFSDTTIAGNSPGAPGAGGNGGTGANGTDGTPGASGSAGLGGGAYDASSSFPLKLLDTIIASNAGGNCAGGAVSDSGNDLSFPDSTCPGINGDPKLGPLGDNGGPAKTIALGAGSAAIDHGAGCPATDERGVPRPGGAACDIGAYEVVGPSASVLPASGVSTTAATLNGSLVPNAGASAVHFEFGTTTTYGSSTPTLSVGGVAATPVTANVAGLKPQTTYHFRVVVTSPDGSATSPDETFQTLSPPPIVPPRIKNLTIKPRTFKPRRPAAGRKSAASISYRDSEAATTTFVVFRVGRGIKHGGRCVRRSAHSRGARCTLLTRVGGFRHSDQAGSNTIGFSGWIGGHALAPGAYVIQATPSAVGQRGSTVSVSFTIK